MRSNQKIMLIDLHFRGSALKKHGYSIIDCANITDALAEIHNLINSKKQLPDVVLLNCYRHRINEIDWFNGILIHGQLGIPLIIMDPFPTADKIQAFRRLGACDYVHENCSMDTLKLQIDLACQKAKHPFLNKKRSKSARKISLAKRAMDIVGAAFLLACLSPLFLIVMIALKIESSGPIFYWQHRIGTGYKKFKFFKFRSMRVNADQWLESMDNHNHYKDERSVEPSNINPHSSTLYVGDDVLIDEETLKRQEIQKQSQSFKKFNNDPRITKVGHWIRKTSIDELPQLVNVIIGDMSLVGNRPLPLYEAETLTSDDWTERFMAPAGITGLWQVTERGKKATSADSRKRLDIEYARNHSLLMDIKILFKTPLAAIQQEKV